MWDVALSKAPINLPKLATQPPNHLDKLLEPLRSLPVPSDSESDCSSGVFDAFEEFHRESFLRPLAGTRRKFLPKLEADWRTVARFSEDFKNTMASTRRSLQLEEGLMSAEEAAVDLELRSEEKRCFCTDFQSCQEKSVRFEGELEESDTTSNSAVWNMIQAHQGPHFSTSPPQYDIYNLKPAHYLKRPHVPWGELEESRRKCEQWLDECHRE